MVRQITMPSSVFVISHGCKSKLMKVNHQQDQRVMTGSNPITMHEAIYSVAALVISQT